MIKLNWTSLKDFLDNRSLTAQYTEDANKYYIQAIDGPFTVFAEVDKDPSDLTDLNDWETNYKPLANSSYTDSNGIPLQRTKITRTGWHYQAHSIELTTSKLASVYNSNIAGTDLGYTSMKFYNSSNVELTAGTQTELDTDCVKTVVSWEPSHDVEVLGGVIFQSTAPTSDTRLWVMAVPDIPAFMGGSVPFLDGGINLRYMGTGQVFDIDGRTPKLMPHNANNHTNKFHLTLTHPAGSQHSIMFVAKVFREAK